VRNAKTTMSVEKQLDYWIKPNKNYLEISKPTTQEIGKLLSAIKMCQQNGYEIRTYEKMAHGMIDTFIKQPMEV
tara:strand:+ start:43565 stop:43786 length:222 start_codon:yes stop_codon:yes gene_type:complete